MTTITHMAVTGSRVVRAMTSAGMPPVQVNAS
jgi:hypothetical protein